MNTKSPNRPTLGNAIRKINPNAMYVIMEDPIYENIEWKDGTTPIPQNELEAKLAEMQTAWDNEIQAEEDLKASAKAKLIAGEKLTEEEANILVGV